MLQRGRCLKTRRPSRKAGFSAERSNLGSPGTSLLPYGSSLLLSAGNQHKLEAWISRLEHLQPRTLFEKRSNSEIIIGPRDYLSSTRYPQPFEVETTLRDHNSRRVACCFGELGDLTTGHLPLPRFKFLSLTSRLVCRFKKSLDRSETSSLSTVQ
jgi:hypothetical protein